MTLRSVVQTGHVDDGAQKLSLRETLGSSRSCHANGYVPGTGDESMIDRYYVPVLYYAAVSLLAFSVLGIPLFFYWTIREEWLVPIVMSGACSAGSFLLTGFWTLKVVYPFVKTAMESTAAQEDGTVPARARRGTISKWILGVGVPLVIVSLEALSLLVYPRLFYSGGWVGAPILVAWVVLLVKALQYYSFFTEPRGPQVQPA